MSYNCILWRCFLNWCSLLSNDSNLCQGDIKLVYIAGGGGGGCLCGGGGGGGGGGVGGLEPFPLRSFPDILDYGTFN